VYAGRVEGGMNNAELKRLWDQLQPLAISEMPLDAPPPRTNCSGSSPILSRMHWVRPELREDKPAAAVRPAMPHPNR
jgi:ATP-dependent DNA ligase